MRYLYFFALAFIAHGLLAQNPPVAQNEVRPINIDMLTDGNQIFYALPRNIIVAEIEVERTENHKGPYSDYAKKLLNITEGIIETTNAYYNIVNVNLKRESITDTTQFYYMSYTGYENMPGIQLNSDFTILGLNCNNIIDGYKPFTIQFNNIIPEQKPMHFTDLGIKPFWAEELVTTTKTIQTDSVPIVLKQTKPKAGATTDDENAEAAAAFIRKIRKRKFKLLTGEYQESIAPDGIALNRMVDELNQLEKNYIELFTGKTQTITEKHYFVFEPSTGADNDQKVLCWFNTQKGIIKQETLKQNLEPIIIKAVVNGAIPQTKIIKTKTTGKNTEQIKYGLYYRIPANTNITVNLLQQVLTNQTMLISQKGQILALPNSYITNNMFSIEYTPETGSIKQIKQKNQPIIEKK